jgi:hypothetical protein
MPDFYARSYALTLIDQQITGLQLDFDVQKDVTKEPDKATIVVYNLTEDHRTLLSNNATPAIQLEAGYNGDNTLLFKGRARRVTNQRQDVNWATTIECGDGLKQIREGTVNVRFPKGAKLSTVVSKIAEELGVSFDQLKNKIREKGLAEGFNEFLGGLTVVGNGHDKIAELGKSLGLQVAIQDESYVAFEPTETRSVQVYRLSPDTGLIGSPDAGDQGIVRAKSFLLPDLRPFDPVELDSASFKGRYRVEKIQHVGSFRDTEWATNIELKPL